MYKSALPRLTSRVCKIVLLPRSYPIMEGVVDSLACLLSFYRRGSDRVLGAFHSSGKTRLVHIHTCT